LNDKTKVRRTALFKFMTLAAVLIAGTVSAQPSAPAGTLRWGSGRNRMPGSLPPSIVGTPASSAPFVPPNHPSSRNLFEFDPPGASTVTAPICEPNNCGTIPSGINDLGVIVGSYMDSNIVSHGFLRLTDGSFITFDAPGAGLGANLFQGTSAYAINNLCEVAGGVQDSANVYHGFIRHPDGSFTTFDAPGAGIRANQGTSASLINLRGEVAGFYLDENSEPHGFVRSPDGSIASFGWQGAQFVLPTSFDDDGTLFGEFADSADIWHCFIREPGGNITVIDAPGAGTVHNTGTLAGTRNLQGEITGTMEDSNNLAHGFIRSPGGDFTIFEAPGAATEGTSDFTLGTGGYAIASSGMVAGTYSDANAVWHGFVRTPGGSFTVVTNPRAGTGPGQGTAVAAINNVCEAAGYYTDSQGLNHGFLWSPCWRRPIRVF
jgi:hypothetical protein